MHRSTTVLSLFSGCGGLDIPFTEPFYRVVGAYDNDPAAIQCLNYNLSFGGSVFDVTSEDFRKELRRVGPVDVVLGGFPCQGFSKAGPKKEEDPRNKLYNAMLFAVIKTQPIIFVAENVDGMAQNFGGRFVRKMERDFYAAGYTVSNCVLNAVNFGVPQYRRRIFFVGIRNGIKSQFQWPEPTHYGGSRNGEFKTSSEVSNQPTLFQPKPLRNPLAIRDALSDLLDADSSFPDHVYDESFSAKDREIMAHVNEGQKLCNVRFSETSVYTWDIPEAFGETTEREKLILETIGRNRRKKQYGTIPNGNPLAPSVISDLSGLAIEEKELLVLVEKGFLKQQDTKYDLKGAMFCSGLYKRPRWDEPAPTVLTVFDKPRYFFHPRRLRPFTVRECARLQSFPDTFSFIESGISFADAYRLIGNAVPPKLAGALASQIRLFLDHYDEELKCG